MDFIKYVYQTAINNNGSNSFIASQIILDTGNKDVKTIMKLIKLAKKSKDFNDFIKKIKYDKSLKDLIKEAKDVKIDFAEDFEIA